MIRLYHVLVFSLVLLSRSSCQAQTAETHTVRIGLILSLTGAWAEFGEAQAQAIKLAIEKSPELFSHIKFITEDCHYGGKEAVAAFNKLRTIDKADLIFVWGVEPALAVAPLAEQNKIPLIVSAIVPSTAKGKKFVIRTINYAEQQAVTLLKYFRLKNYKKIALVKSQMSFNDILVEGLQKNLSAGESLNLIEDVLPTESDFKTTVTKVSRHSYDTLGVLLSPSQILDFFKEAKNQNLKGPIFGASPFQSRTIVSQSEGRMDDSVFVHNDVSRQFEKDYTERFGNDLQLPWAANTYDFVILAGRLFNHLAERPDAEEIIRKFSTVKSESGTGGVFHFVESPEVGKYFEYPLVVKMIRGKEFQVVFQNSDFH